MDKGGEIREPTKALLEALNGTGIPFAEDAWWDENAEQAKKDYGVVEITGSQGLYGDGELVAQNLRGNVILYVLNGQDETAGIIQDALRKIRGLSFALTRKEFLPESLSNRWTWSFELETGLMGTEK